MIVPVVTRPVIGMIALFVNTQHPISLIVK